MTFWAITAVQNAIAEEAYIRGKEKGCEKKFNSADYYWDKWYEIRGTRDWYWEKVHEAKATFPCHGGFITVAVMSGLLWFFSFFFWVFMVADVAFTLEDMAGVGYFSLVCAVVCVVNYLVSVLWQKERRGRELFYWYRKIISINPKVKEMEDDWRNAWDKDRKDRWEHAARQREIEDSIIKIGKSIK